MRSKKSRKFYGWIILLATVLIYFSAGATLWYSYNPMQIALISEFGWSRTVLAIPYTFFLFNISLSSPLIGILVQKFGSRKIIVLGTITSVVGLLGMYLTTEIWQVFLFYSVLGGFGFGFTARMPIEVLLVNWFSRRRSLAFGLQMAAGAAAGSIFTPLITWFISSVGWRFTWIILAGIFLVTGVVSIIVIRNKPEDIGQVPDGETIDTNQILSMEKLIPNRNARANRVYQTSVDWTVKDAFCTRAIWLMMVFSTAMGFARYIIQQHHMLYVKDLGFSAMLAATTLSFHLLMSAVGRIVAGTLGVKFEMRYVSAFFLATLAIGMFIMLNATTIPLLYLYTGLTGLSYGAIMVGPPTLEANYYGRKNFAIINGYLYAEGAITTNFAPAYAAWIYDSTGSYIIAILSGIALLAVGLVCALLAHPPKPKIEKII